jgi:hypothetical protein
VRGLRLYTSVAENESFAGLLRSPDFQRAVATTAHHARREEESGALDPGAYPPVDVFTQPHPSSQSPTKPQWLAGPTEAAAPTRILQFLFVSEVGDNAVTPAPHGSNTGER